MSLRNYRVHVGRILVALFFLACAAVPAVRAQQGNLGTVAVTVVDSSGGVISGAELQLRDLATNAVRNATTQSGGTYSFVNLPVGTYALSVSKAGFQTSQFSSVVVQASQVTDVKASLQVGVATETVVVHEAASPLVQTTSNAIGTVIDLKQIQDLPLQGRDLTELANLVPGVTANSGGGTTWNGLPAIAQGNNIDGVISSTSRMKFSGNAEPAVQPRIENIQEMTVQTDDISASQGYGQGSMQINFVTKRGSNSFHGQAYEDFQNTYLNANSWYNNAVGNPRDVVKLNNFGGSVGGPIKKNKLFFFGTFAESKSPGTRSASATILDNNMQGGTFSYLGTDGSFHTVDVYALAAACNANPSCIGSSAPLPTGPNPVIQAQFAAINGVLSDGKISTPSAGNPDLQRLTWQLATPDTTYYPVVRLDYDMSQSFRLHGTWTETKLSPTLSGRPYFPGAAFAGQANQRYDRNYTATVGFDWTIRPTLINQFTGGYLYDSQGFTSSVGFNTEPTVFWGVGTSPQEYQLHTGQYYPLVSATDTATWQRGAHTVNFGFSYYREQDHYYNPPGGIYGIQLDLSSSDVARNAFTLSTLPAGANNTQVTQARELYATLVGRISGAGSNTGGFAGNGYDAKAGTYTPKTYNLDELQRGWGLFVQDSWRMKPTFTLNASLRWDFTGDDHDLTSAYQGITSNADIYGPSGLGHLFMPGVLTGNPQGGIIAPQAHQYKPWNVSPQPSIGFAWNPSYDHGTLGKLMGGSGRTVIRASFSLRRFTEPYQYFWDTAADYGYGYLQQFNIAPSSSLTGTGFYPDGSLALAASAGGNKTLPAAATGVLPGNAPCAINNQPDCPAATGGWQFVPQTFPAFTAESQYTFLAGGPALKGFDRNIPQPYTQSWNFGIERQIGQNNAIEIRYIGNRVVHQWISWNANEVNIFQNGGLIPGGGSFLNQFQQAQKNMAIDAANGYVDGSGNPTSFADYGFPGQLSTPIFDAAFAGEPLSAGKPIDYSFGDYITLLQQGQAGSFAYNFTNPGGGIGGADYFCNLVGASFAGCQNIGFTGVGAGYPSNYFQVNPFYSGNGTFFMTGAGYTTYNALQVDFRQRNWHGMQFDVNYTWSHNLGLNPANNDWQAGSNLLTLRNPRLAYGPTYYDLRHRIVANGTYDLPFGKGKAYLNNNTLADRIVGGWTIGTIFTFQTGFPVSLYGGYGTFNDFADGGVTLNGVTRSQLQSNIGTYEQPGQSYVNWLNPSLANSVGTWAAPNSTAGSLIPPIYLQMPHSWNVDAAITKMVPIRENIRFSLQGEFLNAFNHPNFNLNYNAPCYAGVDTGVQDIGSFGQTSGCNNSLPRRIELRANLEF